MQPRFWAGCLVTSGPRISFKGGFSLDRATSTLNVNPRNFGGWDNIFHDRDKIFPTEIRSDFGRSYDPEIRDIENPRSYDFDPIL